MHHLLLGHGLATQRLREAAGDREIKLGITLNLGTAHPATDSAEDVDAARRADGLNSRLYLDPLFRGSYPADVVEDLARRNAVLPIEDGDLEAISTPIDVLGVNYYTGWLISHLDENGSPVDSDGALVARDIGRGRPVTAMGWEIVPECFTELLVRLSRDYPGTPIVITENGAAFPDEVAADGSVPDRSARRTSSRTSKQWPRRWPRGPTSGVTSSGRCWTTSSGPTGTTSGSASSGSTTRPRSAP